MILKIKIFCFVVFLYDLLFTAFNLSRSFTALEPFKQLIAMFCCLTIVIYDHSVLDTHVSLPELWDLGSDFDIIFYLLNVSKPEDVSSMPVN